MRKVEKLSDVNSLMSELLEKWPNAKLIETKADFCETEREGITGQNIKMIFKFNLYPSYPSVIEFSHLFSIDASHIRSFLEQKGKDVNLASKTDIESFFENNYIKLRESLRCFNGNKDDYENIANKIIEAKGSTYGKRFGI
ncbi:MAG: hypothetical protein SNJ71_07580 [Bacteroidales bacterium]